MIWNPKHFSWNKKNSPEALFFPAKKGIFFQPPKFEFLAFNTCLFVQLSPLLPLITRHQFLTKRTILHFTSLQGTSSLPRVTLLLYKRGFAALYQKKPTRVWKTLEASFFPEKHDIVVLYLCEVRRHFGFVCRVSSLTSWREYVLGVNEVAGGFLGVCGDWFGFILTSIFSSFSFQFKLYV